MALAQLGLPQKYKVFLSNEEVLYLSDDDLLRLLYEDKKFATTISLYIECWRAVTTKKEEFTFEGETMSTYGVYYSQYTPRFAYYMRCLLRNSTFYNMYENDTCTLIQIMDRWDPLDIDETLNKLVGYARCEEDPMKLFKKSNVRLSLLCCKQQFCSSEDKWVLHPYAHTFVRPDSVFPGIAESYHILEVKVAEARAIVVKNQNENSEFRKMLFDYEGEFGVLWKYIDEKSLDNL